MSEEWKIRRGRLTDKRPTLWTCSGCGYYFWSHGNEQDPIEDGHCSGGFWLADERALEVSYV